VNALSLILQEEGFRSKPYEDTLGVITFGHGLTYITEEESKAIVADRILDINIRFTEAFSWYSKLSLAKQGVLISMVYQLGWYGFSGFKKMIKALSKGDFEEAAKEGLDSRWAKQTPERAKRAMEILAR